MVDEHRTRSRSRSPIRANGSANKNDYDSNYNSTSERRDRDRSRDRGASAAAAGGGGWSDDGDRGRDREARMSDREGEDATGAEKGNGRGAENGNEGGGDRDRPERGSRGGYRGGGRGGFRGGYGGGYGMAAAVAPPGSMRAATEAARRSQKENRVYVGNLAYDVRWNQLKDFMREAGNVVFSEVITLPNGMSKGCGIVEYSTQEEARRAIDTLNETQLNGRTVFIREDREDEARYGQFASPFGRGGAVLPVVARGGGFMGRGGMMGGRGGFMGGGGMGGVGGTSLFVHNLPYEAGWQDLKDLFRQTGGLPIRADINMGPDGRSKGTGTVAFATPLEAQNAIQQLNGYEWNGRMLEVRHDKFAADAGMVGFGGGFAPRGGFRGGFRGGRGGFAGGRGGGFAGGFAPAGGPSLAAAEPSTQIFVKNLPWSTSNEDLVELFQTISHVQEAEIIFQDGRSKGHGIVQFTNVDDAETAINKFNGYVYGGRALEIEFNKHFKDFSQAS